MPVGGAAITGLGAQTSLGDTRTAFAAARAGLARPAPLPWVAWDEDDGELAIVGHPVETVKGFQGEARLLSLAIPALGEALDSARLGGSADVGLCVALPDLEERTRAANVPAPRQLRLLDRLAERYADVRIDPEVRVGFGAGPVGFALALGAGLELLARGRVTACVVGGVDTLCDDLALGALVEQDRLKTPDNPVGLQPGEAAAFVVIETPEAARRRRAPALARISGYAIAEDPRGSGAPPLGEGLAAALRQLAADAGPLPPRDTWFLLDRNGEAGRANDWGYCVHRTVTGLPGLLPAVEWDLATSFGDTGAAGGALAAQACARGFARAYAPGRCGVIVSSSEGGRRSAVRIDRVG